MQKDKIIGSIFLILLAVLIPVLSSAQDMNSAAGDRLALMDLYASTDGNHWHNNTGWGKTKALRAWYGVQVDQNGRVTRLNLSGNGLTGSLPESIGNLTKLKYLNVKQNNLHSTIPSSIGNLKSLTHLLLNGRSFDMNSLSSYHPGKTGGGTGVSERSNRFVGEIPSSIGNLRNLQYLEVIGKGEREIKDGSGYPNSLTGPIPSEIGDLKNLIGLHLGFNSLSSMPSTMQNLTNLVHLGLPGNQFANHGMPVWLGKLTKLKNIWLGYNNLRGPIPDICQLHDLRIFIVTSNDLEGEIPHCLFDGTMPHINMVNLAWNNLTGSLPEFGTPNNLKALQVTGNRLSGTIPGSIDNIPQMINFSLAWNNFEGEIPDLSHMYNLRYLRANNNQFTGSVPMVDVNNDDLQFIHLQNNKLSGELSPALTDLCKLPKFRDLNISNNLFENTDIKPFIYSLQTNGNLDILIY